MTTESDYDIECPNVSCGYLAWGCFLFTFLVSTVSFMGVVGPAVWSIKNDVHIIALNSDH